MKIRKVGLDMDRREELHMSEQHFNLLHQILSFKNVTASVISKKKYKRLLRNAIFSLRK